MSSPPPATTSVEALDGATLAKVYAHLDPRDIVRVSAASKHLASAADEPLFRELFAQAWDEPAWPVASYRDLFLARHRATVAASAVDPAPMMASVESLAALKRGDAKGASTAHLADDARWGVVAAHAEELARAVNASETIDRTDRTIDAANVVRGLHRWLIELTTMAHARRRCLAGEAWWPTSGNRAMLAVSRALSACLTRCPRVRDALLADETQTRSRPEMFSGVPEHPPLRELLGLCVAGPPGAPPALGCGGLAGASPFAAADAAAAEDEAYGGVDHDHGAVDDATLAAAMGGAPVGTRVWPPAKSLPPRIDHCLALALAPLCLRRVAAEGDDDDADDAASRSKAYPLLVPSSFAFDAVPVPASVPSFGPWPRGGRPPHGQRVRLEKSGEPSACAAMSGAWFGARLSLDAAGGTWPAPRLSLDAAFRVGLTSLPDGTLRGWIRDTVGELTLRGLCDPRGDGAVTIEAKFTECGGLPAAALTSWRHGRPRMRLRGWTSSASIGGEWTQWSGGAITRGVFLMWPDDKVRGGSSRGSLSSRDGGAERRRNDA